MIGGRGTRREVWAALLLWGSLACVSSPASGPAWRSPALARVWPTPPDAPRIVHLGQIETPGDLGRRRSLVARLLGTLLGEEDTRLIKPVALAVNAEGLLAVADPSVPTLHLFDLARRRYRALAREDAELLRSPVGVALDARGHSYVADSVRGRVFVFDRKGRLQGEIGAGVLERPTGLALDSSAERLYVADTRACQIVVFDAGGEEVLRFGRRGSGPGELNAPTHLAFAPEGQLLVADSLNFRVQSFAPDGSPLWSVGRAGDASGAFARPKGIALDRSGRLYVVDAAFENVQIFSPRGQLLLAFGGPGTGPGELSLPSGIFIDASNTIFVADAFNRRVQIFRLIEEGE
ncbi:MAG: 6-bladed beta-propeller [Myxococcota bacterium]